MTPIELWGGVECTVNRVGDIYLDQVVRSGHHDRAEDIAQFAALGIRAIRYPILWERVAPAGGEPRWNWVDERLALLRLYGVRVIATLLHHGSGPRTTHLLDPAFAPAFADYAAMVAARYPWITDYTPINEPLTTARFSALYGHWYPHHRDDRSFVRAFMNELRAMVMAMERIRAINPEARLVGTEDVGRVTSTPAIAYQAEFENHRRWLTYDMLCGRVDREHPLWQWLTGCGATPDELEWFRDHACPPSIVGLNYYLTSDRHLDDRCERYPDVTAHGNGRHRYVDVAAVRVAECERPSHRRVLEEAWERYRLPVALTEVHAGCTREEQVRWLASACRGAEAARAAGVKVVAITTWALLGTYDWNTLVTRTDGVYEPGAFDVRSSPPRMTAVGRVAAAFASGSMCDGLASQHGWWDRDQLGTAPSIVVRRLSRPEGTPPPILIVGANGALGSALARACDLRGLHAVAVGRRELDVTDAAAIARAMFRVRPWAVINAVGYADVDQAERDRTTCWLLNTKVAGTLASAAAAFHARYVSFSTDLVFDGRQSRPYVESDVPAPTNEYGLSKAHAEDYIAAQCADALIIRTAALFAPGDAQGFLARALREVSCGRPVSTACDLIISPTYIPHLADQALDLLIDGERGVWHLANRAALSWADFARMAARTAGLDDRLVHDAPASRLGLPARRPPFSALHSERGQVMPPVDRGVVDYLASAGDIWRERRLRSRGL